MVIRLLAVVSACTALLGCAADGGLRVARDQASIDLKCAKQDLNVTKMDNGEYQARGCGATATYACSQSDPAAANGANGWLCTKRP